MRLITTIADNAVQGPKLYAFHAKRVEWIIQKLISFPRQYAHFTFQTPEAAALTKHFLKHMYTIGYYG